MKIQYVSDLHMEFPENFQYLQTHPLKITGDILVVAGDSFYLKDSLMPKTEFWKWASDNYKQVLMVPGNHEFYGGSNVTEKGNSWDYKFLKNVGYYQNKVIRISDTDIILSTLWSHIDNHKLHDVWNGMNDFRQIMYNDKLFTPKDFNTEHKKCLTFIKEAVEESSAKHIVVVTHHVPSVQCVTSQLLCSPLNSAFIVDLTDYIASSRIDFWIYGHSHTNVDTRIGHTEIVSNQLGYVFTGENRKNGFKNTKFFEV